MVKAFSTNARGAFMVLVIKPKEKK